MHIFFIITNNFIMIKKIDYSFLKNSDEKEVFVKIIDTKGEKNENI